MMRDIALAILISFGLVNAAGYFARHLARCGIRNEPTRRWFIVLIWIATIYGSFVFTLPVYLYLTTSKISKGENVSLSEYEGVPSLPPGSREITYYSSHFITEAVFKIDEPALRAWALSNGWSVEEIRSAEYVLFENLKVEATIRAGLLIRSARAEVYFDRQSGLVYFECRDR